MFNDSSHNKTYDDTLSKFREDPLFIIKKIELQQKQLVNKYESLTTGYTKRDLHSRYKNRNYSPINSRNKHLDRSKLYYKRDRKRHSPSRSSSACREDNLKQRSKTVSCKGPQLPHIKDTFQYAFAASDDVLPPSAIIQTARIKQENNKWESRHTSTSQHRSDTKHKQMTLEEMQQQGMEHVRNKMEYIAKQRSLQEQKDKDDESIKGNYAATVQKQALNNVKLVDQIKRRASKRHDPFNDEI